MCALQIQCMHEKGFPGGGQKEIQDRGRNRIQRENKGNYGTELEGGV